MTWAVLTIAAVFLQVLVAEALDWFPWLAERVLRRAARRLPHAQRERWLAEWLGELDALPGRGISKLIFALRVLVTSGATASVLREHRGSAKTSSSYGEFIARGWERIADRATDLVRRRRLEREEEFIQAASEYLESTTTAQSFSPRLVRKIERVLYEDE